MNIIAHFAQTVYDYKLNGNNQNLYNKIKNKLIKRIFNYIERSNPVVEAVIGKYKIKVPFAHKLPFIIKHAPYYSTNLARVARGVKDKYEDLKLIDIGANVGDTVALLRSEVDCPILCIEGDSYFFSLLEKNLDNFSNTYSSKSYIGENTIDLNGTSVALDGTAHLSITENTDDIISIKRLSVVIEENKLFADAKMVKIDTDGYDNKIIRGSIDFLSKSNPILFFEYDPFFLQEQKEDCTSIFLSLSKIGYSKLLIFENEGDFLLSTDIGNNMLIEDLTHYYTNRKGLRYCDICAFHKDDEDIFFKIRQGEIEFFNKIRQ